jgi:hypothetical protein
LVDVVGDGEEVFCGDAVGEGKCFVDIVFGVLD